MMLWCFGYIKLGCRGCHSLSIAYRYGIVISIGHLLPALDAQGLARGAADAANNVLTATDDAPSGATDTAGDVLTAANGGTGQTTGGATDTADNVGGALQGFLKETHDVHLD